jgi:hypothetical protein
MKINFMIVLVVLSFFTVIGLTGTNYYNTYRAIEQGLQQCIVAIDSDTREAIWSKECPANGSEENK